MKNGMGYASLQILIGRVVVRDQRTRTGKEREQVRGR